MKAPVKSKPCAASRKSRARTRGNAAFVFMVRQDQINQAEVRPDHVSRSVRRYLLLQSVGFEAARFYCFSRHRIITRREIAEAWNQLRPRRIPAALAGG